MCSHSIASDLASTPEWLFLLFLLIGGYIVLHGHAKLFRRLNSEGAPDQFLVTSQQEEPWPWASQNIGEEMLLASAVFHSELFSEHCTNDMSPGLRVMIRPMIGNALHS